MKKLVLISFISLILIGSQVSAEVIKDSRFYNQNTLEGMEREFFNEGVITTAPSEDDNDSPDNYYRTMSGNMGSHKSKGLPLFKKCRIKIQNRYRIKEHEVMKPF